MPYSSGSQAFFSSVSTWTMCSEHHKKCICYANWERPSLLDFSDEPPWSSLWKHQSLHEQCGNTHTHNEGGLLRCGLVQSDRYWPTFQRNCLPTLWGLTLMMEAVSSSETSASIYKTTWCNVPQDSHLHTYCRENLKSHRYKRPPHCPFTLCASCEECMYMHS
jgi:hypothetical protein